MFFSHEVHELANKFWDHQVERCRNKGNNDALNHVSQEGKDQIFE